MILLFVETDTSLWQKIVTELESRLEVLREQNETDKSHDETMKIRGRIAEVKAIMAWADPPKDIKYD